MNINYRYTRGAGNYAIFARVRSFSGEYWNFTTHAWDASESANTKAYFNEYLDSDLTTSFYSRTITPPPNGTYPIEIVESGGSVLTGIDSDILESTLTKDGALRCILAVILGLNPVDTTTEYFRDIANTKNRVVGTVDGTGIRTAVTLDGE